MSSSSQTALKLAQMADKFASKEVSVATKDTQWAKKNGAELTQHISETELVQAKASKKASETLLAATQDWAKKMKALVTQVAKTASVAAKGDNSKPAACPGGKLPVTDVLRKIQECGQLSPLQYNRVSKHVDDYSVLALLQLAESKPGTTDESKNIPVEMQDLKSPDDDVATDIVGRAAAEQTADEIAERKKEVEENDLHLPPAADEIIKSMDNGESLVPKVAPLTTTTTTTAAATTTLPYENLMRNLLQQLSNYKFSLDKKSLFFRDVKLANELKLDITTTPKFTHMVEDIKKAANASLQTCNAYAVSGTDTELALRKAKEFAAKAAGAELNARQLFRVFRRQFTVDEGANDEYGNALAESYNAKSKERDRVLREHEMESYILARIRKKAQVSAANFSRASDEIRQGVTSFTSAVLSRAIAQQKCATSNIETLKVWRPDITKQLQDCVVELATMQALGARYNFLDATISVGPRILEATKLLDKLVEDIGDLRARKPDIPVARDYSLVRTWDEQRIAPLVTWAEVRLQALKDRWLVLRVVNSTDDAQHKVMMGLFKRINFGLHPTTNALAPQKASNCCGDDGAEFIQLKSKSSHGNHLRGRTLHAQQSVLGTDPSLLLAAQNSVKPISKDPKERVLALARFLDNSVNTGFTPQVKALQDRFPAIVGSKEVILAAAQAQKNAYDRLLKALKLYTTEDYATSVLRDINNAGSGFDKKVNDAKIAQTSNRCRILDLSIHVGRQLNVFSTDFVASAEATVTRLRALDTLANAWAQVAPHTVHHQMVDVAEKRSLRILKTSGIRANISDARVHAIQDQINKLRVARGLQTHQRKEWYDVIALAEADAKDANGGTRLRAVIVDLLPIRAKAVADLTEGIASFRNISEVILADLESRVKERESAYVSQMGKQSEVNAEAKLRKAELLEQLEPKTRAVKDLEDRLSSNKGEIATVEETLRDAQADKSTTQDELQVLRKTLEKHQQSNKEIVANLAEARAVVAKEQSKLDSIHVGATDQDEASQEKAFKQWTQRLETSLNAVRKLLRGTISKLDSEASMISTFHPPTPTALEKMVGKELPPEYADIYNTVTRLTSVIEQSTLKIRVANVLRNKLGIAKAYRDSDNFHTELVRIRDDTQASVVLPIITEVVPALKQAMTSFGNQLPKMIKAQIAAVYLRDLATKEAEDRKIVARIPPALSAVRTIQTTVRKLTSEIEFYRKKNGKAHAKSQKEQNKLDGLLANTTKIEDALKDAVNKAQVNKTITIKDLLTVSENIQKDKNDMMQLQVEINKYADRRTSFQQEVNSLEDQVSKFKINTDKVCKTANDAVAQLKGLSDEMKELMQVTPDTFKEKLQPCVQAKADLQSLQSKYAEATKSLQETEAALDQAQKKRSSTMDAYVAATNKNAELRHNLREIASTQAQVEADLREAKLNVIKHQPVIDAYQAHVVDAKRFEMKNNHKIDVLVNKLEIAQKNARDALATATGIMNEHHDHQRDIQQLKASCKKYQLDDTPVNVITKVSQQAKLATDLAKQLTKLLSNLREEQSKATAERVDVLRKLAQSMMNAFACTGCKSMDTATVFERPPLDKFVDTSSGNGLEDKETVVKLYSNYVRKATKFSDTPAPEDTAWRTSVLSSNSLLDVLSKKVLAQAQTG